MADKTQRSFEKEYLEKRCETLGQFLDCICESETLRSSIHVLSFLKCTDEDQWTKIKEELEKNQKKTSGLRDNFSKKLFEGKSGLRVEDFDNLHGDLQCRITGSLKDYSNELDELIKVSEPLYQKYIYDLSRLIDQMKQLTLEFGAVSTTINKIADSATDLYNTHKKFNDSVKSHKWERMQDIYASLNQTMVSWGRYCVSDRRKVAQETSGYYEPVHAQVLQVHF